MKQAYCYMPSWNGDKLVKRGSYCNWPSVAAHAQHLFREGDVSQEQLNDIMAHINSQAGPIVDPSRCHYSFLEHFAPVQGHDNIHNYTMAEYMAQCATNEAPLTFVTLSATGSVCECTISPVEGKYEIDDVVRPRGHGRGFPVTKFSSLRKIKGASKDTNLYVYHWAGATEPNPTASNLFKLQLYGEVAIVQMQKASGMPPRDRYFNFDVAQFNDLFNKKRRRGTHAEVTALTPAEYQSMKEEMQTSLTGYEAQISSGAEPLADQGSVMPPQSGKELAVVAQLMGNMPPVKRQCLEARLSPPQVMAVGRQVSVGA